jgi:hypothetical protein
MAKKQNLDPEVYERLLAYYGQVMWLAQQPFVSPGMARAWFSHIAVERVRRSIRMFTGKVSVKAAKDPTAVLRLEHQKRIQTTITQLVSRHMKLKKPRPKEFIETIIRCEQVHVGNRPVSTVSLAG